MVASLYPNPLSVDDVIDLTDIGDLAERRTTKLSGGQTQRLRFAIALVSNPDLLVLDEPTVGLDVEARHEFWVTMRAFVSRGKTVIFATHYLEEADAYADRIILLRHGKIVADGTSAEVKAMAAGRTVRATLANPDQARLSAIPGADSVEVRGDTVLIHSSDSDAVARYLLTSTPARDLEINTRGLEDAFIALTSDDNDTPGEGSR
jgi:ABC-2 type transport system ATP-binding protein